MTFTLLLLFGSGTRPNADGRHQLGRKLLLLLLLLGLGISTLRQQLEEECCSRCLALRMGKHLLSGDMMRGFCGQL